MPQWPWRPIVERLDLETGFAGEGLFHGHGHRRGWSENRSRCLPEIVQGECRLLHNRPVGSVIVATVRALKMHGGVAKEALSKENTKAVIVGCGNLHRHIENVQGYGIPVVVAINRFSSDSESEIDAILSACAENGVEGIEANHWADGGAGAQALAETVVKVLENEPSWFKMLYEDSVSLWDKDMDHRQANLLCRRHHCG